MSCGVCTYHLVKLHANHIIFFPKPQNKDLIHCLHDCRINLVLGLEFIEEVAHVDVVDG